MSIAGKNTVHFTKKDLQDSKIPSVAFKNLKFAHEATLGQTVINVLNLTTPTSGMPASFVQPSAGDLAAVRLQTNKNNFRLISSLNGYLAFDSYEITGQSQITLGYPAAAGEVFEGILDNTAKTGLQVIDNNPVVKTILLPAGTNELIVGIPFDVNKYPTEQTGAVLVYEEGQLLFRNVSNTQSTGGSGDYYEVDNGGPTSNSIMINNTSTEDRNFIVLSNGFMAAAPSESLLTQLQVLAGQLDAVIPTVAALAGVPATDFQAAPNDVDQAAFGNRVLALESVVEGQGLIVGRVDGVAVPAGYIGEVITSPVATGGFTTGVAKDVATIDLPAGVWMIYAQIYYNETGTTSVDRTVTTISTASTVQDYEYVDFNPIVSSNDSTGRVERYANIAGLTTFYITGFVQFTGGSVATLDSRCKLYAVRIG